MDTAPVECTEVLERWKQALEPRLIRGSAWWGIRRIIRIPDLNEDSVTQIREAFPQVRTIRVRNDPGGDPRIPGLAQLLDDARRPITPAASSINAVADPGYPDSGGTKSGPRHSSGDPHANSSEQQWPELHRFNLLVASLRGKNSGETARAGLRFRERMRERVPNIINLGVLGATLLSAASIKQFLAGDVAWDLGWILLCASLGVAALDIVYILSVGSWRLGRAYVQEPATNRELADAFFRDLRFDWRRIFVPLRWLRQRNVPADLPIVIVQKGSIDNLPAGSPIKEMLNAYERQYGVTWRLAVYVCARFNFPGKWYGTALKWMIHAIAIMVPPGILIGLILLAEELARTSRSIPGWALLLSSLLLAWRISPAGRVPSAVLITDAETDFDPLRFENQPPHPIKYNRRLRDSARVLNRLVTFFAPIQANRRPWRMALLFATFISVSAVYVAHQNPDHPYCLPPTGELSSREQYMDDELIGYRSCLDWSHLVRDGVSGLSSHLAGPFAASQPGPDDTRGLFDENMIYEENRRVQRLSQGNDIVSILVITSLTTHESQNSARSVVAEREGLAGAYLAQRRINTRRAKSRDHYVRLIIANVGDLSSTADPARYQAHLDWLDTQLVELIKGKKEQEGAVAAAIATVNSIMYVKNLLSDIEALGIPVMTPTMSADDFEPNPSKNLFFQMNSINADEIALALTRAASERKDFAFIYPGEIDPNDLYMVSLYCDTLYMKWVSAGEKPEIPGNDPACQKSSFPFKQIRDKAPSQRSPSTDAASSPLINAAWTKVRTLLKTPVPPRHAPASPPASQERPDLLKTVDTVGISLHAWNPRDENSSLREICPTGSSAKRDSVAFFGGRYTEVPEMISSLRIACGDNMPEIILADSALRLLADAGLAQHIPHGTKVLVAGRTPLLTCDALRARPQKPAQADGQLIGRRSDFFDDLTGFLQRCAGRSTNSADRWLLNGWAASSYDTVLTMDIAIHSASRPSHKPGPADVESCLKHVKTMCAASGLPGSFGSTTLEDEDRAAHLPLSLLQVNDLAAGFNPASDGIVQCVPDPHQHPWVYVPPQADGSCQLLQSDALDGLAFARTVMADPKQWNAASPALGISAGGVVALPWSIFEREMAKRHHVASLTAMEKQGLFHCEKRRTTWRAIFGSGVIPPPAGATVHPLASRGYLRAPCPIPSQ